MQPKGRRWRLDERRFRSLVENASDVITVVAPDLTVLFQTESGAQLLGYRAEQLEGTKFSTLVDPPALMRLRVACSQAADGINHGPVELRLQHRDGTWLDTETVVRYEPDEGHLVLTTRDARERKRAERKLRRHAEQQAVVATLGRRALRGEELPELMLHAASEVANALGADYAGVHHYVPERDAFVLSAGVGPEPVRLSVATVPVHGSQLGLTLGATHAVIVRDWKEERQSAEAAVCAAHGMVSAISVLVPGGETPFGAMSVQAGRRGHFQYDDGVFLQAIANILAAAVARHEGEETLRHQALHDGLTGLPNRLLLEDRLTRALATATRHGRRLAVLMLDVDDFKRINDSLGHAVGDQVLRSVAERLGSCLRTEDTLARLGGDEFVILLPEIDADADWVTVIEKIRDALALPLTIDGRDIVTNIGIGVASGGEGHDKDAQALVRDADLAMYAAKQRGHGNWEVFAEKMYDAALRRLDLTGDLHQALERGQLDVHYQPIVSLLDQSIMGAEALVRWNHPRHGSLLPSVFLPLAEEAGLMGTLGRHVLRSACENLRRWQLSYPRHGDLYVSVNLSTQEIQDPGLLDQVKGVLAEADVPPSTLFLEITEGALLDTDDEAMARLRALKDLGVRLAVDDFGTGYSALSYLQRFPIDVVKIDKTFTAGLGALEQQRLVKGIIDLAHGVHLKTIAEGVETAEQSVALRTMNAEFAQGFYFARPMTSRQMEAMLSLSVAEAV